jgi:TonB family protein
MTREEARRLGAAVGCDFFVTGKTETLARSEREGQSREEAYAGVMIVDGRGGALAIFDFHFEMGATRDAAQGALATALEARAAGYIQRMIDYTAARARTGRRDETSREPVEDLPAQGSPQSEGFVAPQFLNRVKPEYTEEAGRADINATVEAKAVFRASGEVGEVEITRWAGFGLDQAAERAIRQLKFKPATRDGDAVSVRATVQYNFRRVNESDGKTPTTP